MTRAKQKGKAKAKAATISCYNADTFSGLQANDSSRPSRTHPELVRDLPPAKRQKNDARSTEGRVARDGERMDLKLLHQAVKNKVILPFRLSDFLRDKHNNRDPSIRIEGGTTYKPLKSTKTRLLEKDGPRLVVDLDDKIVLLYCPNFIGCGLQLELNNLLSELVTVNPPKKDGITPDRRGNQTTTYSKACPPENPAFSSSAIYSNVASSATNSRALRAQRRQHAKDSLPQAQDGQVPRMGRGETKTVACESEDEDIARANKEDGIEPNGADVQVSSLWRSALDPSSYLWSPLLYQTAQEYCTSIQPSSGLRSALSEKSLAATMAFLEAKRLLDARFLRVLEIVHPDLARIIGELRNKVLLAEGTDPAKVLENGWTSPFPNFIVAFNRQTGAHRDSKGIENGMDFLLLLGKFVGGRFVVPDLDLKLDWRPGFFCALDGYTFTHRVERWEGRQRTCLINFCHGAAFGGQDVNCDIPTPTATGMAERLTSVVQEVKEERAESFRILCELETDRARKSSGI